MKSSTPCMFFVLNTIIITIYGADSTSKGHIQRVPRLIQEVQLYHTAQEEFLQAQYIQNSEKKYALLQKSHATMQAFSQSEQGTSPETDFNIGVLHAQMADTAPSGKTKRKHRHEARQCFTAASALTVALYNQACMKHHQAPQEAFDLYAQASTQMAQAYINMLQITRKYKDSCKGCVMPPVPAYMQKIPNQSTILKLHSAQLQFEQKKDGIGMRLLQDAAMDFHPLNGIAWLEMGRYALHKKAYPDAASYLLELHELLNECPIDGLSDQLHATICQTVNEWYEHRFAIEQANIQQKEPGLTVSELCKKTIESVVSDKTFCSSLEALLMLSEQADYPEGLFTYGLLCEHLGQKEKTRALIMRGAKKGHIKSICRLASMYKADGNLAKAESYLKDAAKKYPARDIFRILGEFEACKEKQLTPQHTQKALHWFKKAQQLGCAISAANVINIELSLQRGLITDPDQRCKQIEEIITQLQETHAQEVDLEQKDLFATMIANMQSWLSRCYQDLITIRCARLRIKHHPRIVTPEMYRQAGIQELQEKAFMTLNTANVPTLPSRLLDFARAEKMLGKESTMCSFLLRLIKANAQESEAYNLIGDYFLQHGNYAVARNNYERGAQHDNYYAAQEEYLQKSIYTVQVDNPGGRLAIGFMKFAGLGYMHDLDQAKSCLEYAFTGITQEMCKVKQALKEPSIHSDIRTFLKDKHTLLEQQAGKAARWVALTLMAHPRYLDGGNIQTKTKFSKVTEPLGKSQNGDVQYAWGCVYENMLKHKHKKKALNHIRLQEGYKPLASPSDIDADILYRAYTNYRNASEEKNLAGRYHLAALCLTHHKELDALEKLDIPALTTSEKTLRAIIEEEPSKGQSYFYVAAHELYARLLLQQDKLHESEEYYEKAAEFGPDIVSPESCIHIAQQYIVAYQMQKIDDDAQKAVEYLKKAAPHSVQAQKILNDVLKERKKMVTA